MADAAKEFGGRLRFETRAAGTCDLGTGGRLAIGPAARTSERQPVIRGASSPPDDILGSEHRHVVVATGARWTKMLFSTLEFPVGELDVPGVYTPDDLADGVVPPAPWPCSISTITTWAAPSRCTLRTMRRR